MVKITQETAGYFTFELDGVVIAKNIRNDLFIRNDGGIFRCDFKTATGANILSKQRIMLSDVTVVTDTGVEYPPFATPNALFLALIEVGYFDWMGTFSGGGGSVGVVRFKDLLDAFNYPGNDGKVPVVNEAQNRLDPQVLFNIKNFSELYDVSSIAIDASLQNKTLTVLPITNGTETIYKIAWVDFPTPNNIPQDGFITLGTQSLVDGEFTASVGYTWRISGGLFGNSEEYSETIEPEEPGSYRKDKIVVTQDGENPFQYIPGIPSGDENSALEPQTPPGTLQLTTIDIFGDVITNGGENPIIGTDYITKLSQSDVLINTSSSAITLNLDQNGKNRYRIQSTGANAHILGISKIDAGIVIPNQDYPYNGKEILICNEKVTDLIVDAGTPTSSLYAFEKSLTIPPDGIATFKMYESEGLCKLKSTNFSIVGEFIPLSGTEEGRPITGNLEFSDTDNIGISNAAGNLYHNFFTDDGFNEIGGALNLLTPNGLFTFGTGEKGIVGSEEFDKQADRNAFAQLSDVAFVSVKWFGAKGDGITDDTESIQDAIDSINNQGATLYFPAGKYLATQLNVNEQIIFRGDGVPSLGLNIDTPTGSEFEPIGSVIISNSSTQDLLVSNSYGVSFKDIAFWNNSVNEPTAGVGVRLLNAGSFVADNLQVKGFYTNLEIYQGTRWAISNSNFFYPKNTGIYIHNDTDVPGFTDTGDTSITGCNIITDKDGVTGIRYESSGGLKISNTKINPSNLTRVGIPIDVFITGSTSILLLANNSFEGFNQYGVRIRHDVDKAFGQVVITGNQFFPVANSITGNCIYAEDLDIMTIVGNSFNNRGYTNSNPAVRLVNCSNLTVDPNTYAYWETGISLEDCTGYNRPLLENGNQTKNGSLVIKSDADFFPFAVGGAGGTDYFAIGNIYGKPSIQGVDILGNAVDICFQEIGGNGIFGGAVQLANATASNQAAALGQIVANVNSLAATLNLATTARTNYYQHTGTGATWQLPDATTNVMNRIVCTHKGSGVLTISSTGSQIWESGSASPTYVASVGESVNLYSDGVNWIVL